MGSAHISVFIYEGVFIISVRIAGGRVHACVGGCVRACVLARARVCASLRGRGRGRVDMYHNEKGCMSPNYPDILVNCIIDMLRDTFQQVR